MGRSVFIPPTRFRCLAGLCFLYLHGSIGFLQSTTARGLHYADAALLSDIQHMAGILTQNGLDISFERIKHLQRDKCLNGTGKATTVNTVSAPALQKMLAHGQCQRHILVFLIAGRDHILQVHIG